MILQPEPISVLRPIVMLSITLGETAPEGALDVEWDDGAVRMVLSR